MQGSGCAGRVIDRRNIYDLIIDTEMFIDGARRDSQPASVYSTLFLGDIYLMLSAESGGHLSILGPA